MSCIFVTGCSVSLVHEEMRKREKEGIKGQGRERRCTALQHVSGQSPLVGRSVGQSQSRPARQPLCENNQLTIDVT